MVAGGKRTPAKTNAKCRKQKANPFCRAKIICRPRIFNLLYKFGFVLSFGSMHMPEVLCNTVVLESL